MKLFRTTGLLIALALFGYVVWMNYDMLREAYGSGPPYFGRTVNMDKWHNPVPSLLLVDCLTLLIVAVAIKMFRARHTEAQDFEAQDFEAQDGE